ncbi:MAG: hypothetical protein O7I42_03920 [Alphaproteobacteria bacterium]|nr:hypothetical protein [Alphaproteobacteria bacterium]
MRSRSFMPALFAALLLGLLAGCYSYAERRGTEASGTAAGKQAAVVPAAVSKASSKAAARQIAALGLPTIRLAVAELQVIPAYATPGHPPNVEHRMKAPLQAVAAQWARGNVRAVGTFNRARVIVRRASIVGVALKRKTGVSGLFRKEPNTRFDGTLALAIEVRNDKGDLLGQVSAKATRSREVLEGSSEEDHKAVWRAMAERLVADVARELERQVSLRLTRFAR